ncbi:MAG: hypothetical protein HY784_00055 [Chloroflexi bacterium]|nr:hypothetical protein [Chloroflexota bacterium]
MSQTTTITLPPRTVAQLEPLPAETHESLEAIVNYAIADYVRSWEKRALRERLAREYDELAAMWDELGEDVNAER